MAALRTAFLALALGAAAPASAQPLDRWAAHIADASARFAIPESWIRRVISAESGGRTSLGGRPIQSSAGAMGLMQLMPATWRDMRAAHGLGSDPNGPRDNIMAGTAYLRAMFDRFGYPGLFAAYNAGPARFATHRATGRPLPAETLAYVAKVTSDPMEPARRAGQVLPRQTIFVSLRRAPAPPPAPESLFGTRAADALFVPLSTASLR